MKIIVLIACIAAGGVFAGDTPSWDELAMLYGQSVDSTNMVAFAQRYGLRKHRKFDEGGFTPENNSFSVLFRRNTVDCVILHIKHTWGDKKWTAYDHELPFGLSPTNTLAQVIGKFGTTNAGPETWLISDFKVWPHFQDKTNAIFEVYMWKTRGPNNAVAPTRATEGARGLP